MQKFYNESIENVYSLLHSGENGLSKEEAKERLIENGENTLKEKNRKGALKIFFSQFNNMMIILLLLVGVVSLVYSIVNNESIIESIVIFGCVLINAFMGFVQELKSENAIESLKTMTESKAVVKREGEFEEISASEIVVGDIIILEAGDTVPADARIISASFAKVDESILTGESIAVDKTDEVLSGDNKIIQEQANIIFSGTSLVNGRIEAVVIRTGMDTELGKIAGKLDT